MIPLIGQIHMFLRRIPSITLHIYFLPYINVWDRRRSLVIPPRDQTSRALLCYWNPRVVLFLCFRHYHFSSFILSSNCGLQPIKGSMPSFRSQREIRATQTVKGKLLLSVFMIPSSVQKSRCVWLGVSREKGCHTSLTLTAIASCSWLAIIRPEDLLPYD